MSTTTNRAAPPSARDRWPDETLAAAVRATDEDAFSALLGRYRVRILSWIRPYFLPGADPADLMQEAMTGLYKAALDYCAGKGPFGPFARLCVMRYVVTAVKGATRGKHRPLNTAHSLDAPLPAEDADCTLLDFLAGPASLEPEHQLEQSLNETEFDAWRATALSELERRACDLYLDEHNYQDIARVMGVTPKQVDNALQRVRRKALHRYGEYGERGAPRVGCGDRDPAVGASSSQLQNGSGPPTLGQRRVVNSLRRVRAVSIPAIQYAVAEFFGIRTEGMTTKRRAKDVALPRQIAMYLCRELTDASLPRIGKEFGGRHHTTVVHACVRVKQALLDDAHLNTDVQSLVESFWTTRPEAPERQPTSAQDREVA